jgi:hypothetical protein
VLRLRLHANTLVIGLVCLCAAYSASAQEDPILPLFPGTPLEVALVNGAPVRLVYQAEEREVISVSARSLVPSALDTFLVVLDPGGALLALNDDHDRFNADLVDTDAWITEITLPDAGEYPILLRTFDGHGSGAVEVLLSVHPPAPTQAEIAAANTGMDRYLLGVPPNGVSDQPVYLVAGQQITVTARTITAGFDPVLELIDPTLTIIASNDDNLTGNATLGSQDAEITGSIIALTGTYVLRLRSVSGAGGDVELVVSRALAPQTSEPVGIPLRDDIVVHGIIGVGEVFEQTLVAEAGDLISISVLAGSPALDVRIALLTLAKQVIDTGERVDVTRDLPARIERLIIRQGGTYVVQVMGYLESSGDFTLTIQHLARDVSLFAPAAETQRGETQMEGVYSQALDAQAGDFVTVSVRAMTPGYDPRVYLRTAEGELLALNDDHGSADPTLALLDARIRNYPIPITGTYVIEVDSYDGAPGAFEIVTERLPAAQARP